MLTNSKNVNDLKTCSWIWKMLLIRKMFTISIKKIRKKKEKRSWKKRKTKMKKKGRTKNDKAKIPNDEDGGLCQVASGREPKRCASRQWRLRHRPGGDGCRWAICRLATNTVGNKVIWLTFSSVVSHLPIHAAPPPSNFVGYQRNFQPTCVLCQSPNKYAHCP